MAENVIPMKRVPVSLTPEKEARCYTLWLRLDNAGFALIVDGGVLQLQDRHEPPRTVMELVADVEALRAVYEYQLAKADHAAMAAYVEREHGKLTRIKFDV